MNLQKVIVLASAILVSSLDAFSFVSVSTISVTTTSPNDCSTTTVTASGTLGAGNYSYSGATTSISGSTITVDVNYTSGLIILPVIIPFSQSISLGTLNSGSFTLIVRGMLNGTQSSTLNYSPSLVIASCCALEAGFTSDAPAYCMGDTVRLTDTSSSSATSFYWYLNGSLVDSTQNYSFVANTAGTNSIKLIVNDTCGTDSVVKTVNVLADPDLGPDTTVCSNRNYRLEVSILWNTITWTGGSTANFISVGNAGTYTVVVGSATGCVRRDTVTITQVGTALDLGPDQVYCPGDTAKLDAGSRWRSVIWSNGHTGPEYDVFFPATFYVYAVDTNFCAYWDTIDVSGSSFNLNVAGPDSICSGDTAQILVNGNWLNTQWSNGDTGSSAFLQMAGNYSVTSTSLDSCVQNITFDLAVIDYPEFQLSDTSLCEVDSVSYDYSALGTEFLWDDMSTSGLRTISSAGMISLRISNYNLCASEDSAMISFYSYPSVDLGPDQALCIGDTALLIASGSSSNVQWSTGQTDSSIRVITSGQYIVEVNNGVTCFDSDTIDISFQECDTSVTSINFFRVDLELRISPNPVSSTLFLERTETEFSTAEIMIFDLQGRKVWTLSGTLEKRKQIDVSKLESGMYILQVQAEGRIQSRMFRKL